MKFLVIFLFLVITPFVLTNMDSSIKEGRYANLRNMQAKWNHLDLLEGVEGDNYLKVNKYGLKGDLFGKEKFRVLVIGNSLSEGALLDDSEIWSRVLEKELRSKKIDVKVFNAAKSGSISARRFIDVFEAYKDYRFDAVILYPMAKFNPAYRSDEGFSEYYVPDYKNEKFSIKNNSVVQILRNRKWEFASYIKRRFGVNLFKNTIVNPDHVKAINEKAKKRRSLEPFVMSKEYLDQYRKDYEKGIKLVTDYFKKARVPVILIERLHVTHMDSNDKDLALWWGDLVEDKRIKKEDYSKIIELEHKIMRQYSNRQTAILRQDQLEVDPSWFFDQHHFNEKGSKELGKALSPYVLQFLQ